MDNFLDHEIKGVPIGHFPELSPGTKIIWRSPLDYFERNHIHLITLGQGNTEDEIIIGFCSWSQDHRFKPEVKGTGPATKSYSMEDRYTLYKEWI